MSSNPAEIINISQHQEVDVREIRACMFINPVAGDMSSRRKNVLRLVIKLGLEKAGWDVTTIETGKQGEIVERLKDEELRNALLVFLGGDGTFQEAIGLGYKDLTVDSVVNELHTRKVMIAFGSVNLLPRELGCNSIKTGLQLALGEGEKFNLDGLKVSWIDPVSLESCEKVALSVVNSGLDSDLFWRQQEYSKLLLNNKLLSRFWWWVSFLSIFLSRKVLYGIYIGFRLAYETIRGKYVFPVNRIKVNGEMIKANVAIASNIATIANGWSAFPQADPTDGKIEVLCFHKLSVRQVFKAIFFAVMHRAEKLPEAVIYKDVKSLSFFSHDEDQVPKSKTFCLDGEAMEYIGELKIEVIPGCFPVEGISLQKDRPAFRGKVFDFFENYLKKKRN